VFAGLSLAKVLIPNCGVQEFFSGLDDCNDGEVGHKLVETLDKI
jgi:hypothetical protein